MTNEQAINVLAVLPRYELVDITVVSTDGHRASGFVVYTKDGGELLTMPIEWERISASLSIADVKKGFEEHQDALAVLLGEISGECREAADYQRDLLRAKN